MIESSADLSKFVGTTHAYSLREVPVTVHHVVQSGTQVTQTRNNQSIEQ